MKYVYHGSKTSNLKKINRNISSHKENWVYGTVSKATSTIFISNGGNDLKYYLGGKGTKESPILLVERKEGMFDQIFNLSGSIYTLNSKNFCVGKTGWSAEIVSAFDEEVISEEYIDNVLIKLEELNNNGEIKLYRYPNRPAFIPLDNSDLINVAINWYIKGFNINNFLKLYPELEKDFFIKLNDTLISFSDTKKISKY